MWTAGIWEIPAKYGYPELEPRDCLNEAMKNRIVTLLLAWMLIGCLGCQSKTTLVLRDSNGKVVATIRLVLPKLGGDDKQFTGNWQLVSANPGFPRQAVTPGSYKGSAQIGTISIDLNPGVDDNNVRLTGTVKGELLSGEWYHCTFAGANPMGTFGR